MNKINYTLLLSMNEINSAAFLGFEKLFTPNSNKKNTLYACSKIIQSITIQIHP